MFEYSFSIKLHHTRW